MAKKPSPKPARKPAPKAPALSGPSFNPFDVVRNPDFGAAMAQQDYFNNLSRLVAERNARGSEYNLMPIGGTNQPIVQNPNPPNLMPIGQFSPEQIQSLSPDRRMALEQRMGAQQTPSLSQMQDYNRMLQQGIQNSNTMNQGAMANFANMQPGMQAPQQPRPTIPNPAMPAAGMGIQQPRQVPAQRNFSTLNNAPAIFG